MIRVKTFPDTRLDARGFPLMYQSTEFTFGRDDTSHLQKKLKAEGECSRLYFLLPIGKLAPKGILLWKGNFNFPQPDQSITMHYVCVGKKNYE